MTGMLGAVFWGPLGVSHVGIPNSSVLGSAGGLTPLLAALDDGRFPISSRLQQTSAVLWMPSRSVNLKLCLNGGAPSEPSEGTKSPVAISLAGVDRPPFKLPRSAPSWNATPPSLPHSSIWSGVPVQFAGLMAVVAVHEAVFAPPVTLGLNHPL